MSVVFCSLAHKSRWAEVIQEIDERCRPLWIATPSTAFYLRDLGCQVKSIHDVGVPAQMLGGKVKTLHPRVFSAILADPSLDPELQELKRDGVEPFDLVLVDIYALKSGTEFSLSQIDIGGPAALRAACKNHEHCLPIARPDRLKELLVDHALNSKAKLTDWVRNLPSRTKSQCAADVLLMLSEVNRAIALELLNQDDRDWPGLVYGDNPEEPVSICPMPLWNGESSQDVLSLDDKRIRRHPEMMKFSWNNMMDIHHALSLFQWIDAPCMAAIMKHHHPCGIGYSQDSIEDAFEAAHDCDPLSAYGGVVVFNQVPSLKFWERLKGLFVDLVVLPTNPKEGFETLIKQRPSQRVISIPMDEIDPSLFKHQRHRTCFGDVSLVKWGSLETACDPTRWNTFVGSVPVTSEVATIVKRAYAVVSHLYSNAIAICSPVGTIGLGVGFVNRVQAIMHAVKQAKNKTSKKPIVLASDGFMPFADNIEMLEAFPVDVVVQPGGSRRDEDVIEACAKRGITLIMTGSRVFYHGI